MKLPYGYVLLGEEISVHEEKADVIRSILEYNLAEPAWEKLLICSIQTASHLQQEI